MVELFLWTISITAGFISGVIALFAPCCLTVLLPVYLSQIVQTRFKVVLATLVFSLGIASVMLPIALGFRALVSIFNVYHPYFYGIGGLVMILAGVLLIGRFTLPMWVTPRQVEGRVTFGSLYLLGVTSGLASACCAPVLLGAVTLVSVTPSYLLALLVGLSYVFGMILPLLLGALLTRTSWLLRLRQTLGRPVGQTTIGNLIGGGTMIVYGLLLAILSLTGNLTEIQDSPSFLRFSSQIGRYVTKYLNEQPIVSILSVVGLLASCYWIIKVVQKEVKVKKEEDD